MIYTWEALQAIYNAEVNNKKDNFTDRNGLSPRDKARHEFLDRYDGVKVVDKYDLEVYPQTWESLTIDLHHITSYKPGWGGCPSERGMCSGYY